MAHLSPALHPRPLPLLADEVSVAVPAAPPTALPSQSGSGSGSLAGVDARVEGGSLQMSDALEDDVGGGTTQVLTHGEDGLQGIVAGTDGQALDGENQDRRLEEHDPAFSNSVATGVEETNIVQQITPQVSSEIPPSEIPPSEIPPARIPPSPPVQQHQEVHQETNVESSIQANHQTLQHVPDQTVDEAHVEPIPISIDPSSISIEIQSQHVLQTAAILPDTVPQLANAPPEEASGDVHVGDGQIEEVEVVKKVPILPPDGGFTTNGKVRVPKNVEFEEDKVMHGIDIHPLTTFLSTLPPLPLQKVHKILLNCKTPKSYQRIDARLAEWETEDVDESEQMPSGVATHSTGKDAQSTSESTKETPTDTIIRELRIDMSTLHPSALYRLEEFRRHHLSLPDLRVDFITYLRWKTIDEKEVERLTLKADGPPFVKDQKGEGTPAKKSWVNIAAEEQQEQQEHIGDAESDVISKETHQSSESEFEAPKSTRSTRNKGEPTRKRGRPRKVKVDEEKASTLLKDDTEVEGAADDDAGNAQPIDTEMDERPLEDANDPTRVETVADALPVDESPNVEATKYRSGRTSTARGRKSVAVEIPVASRSSRRISGIDSSSKSSVVALRSSMRGKNRAEPATPEGGRCVHFPAPNQRNNRSVSFDILTDIVDVDSKGNGKRGTVSLDDVKSNETGRRGRPRGAGRSRGGANSAAGPSTFPINIEQNENEINKPKTKKLRMMVEVVIPIRKSTRGIKSTKMLGKRSRGPSDDPHEHVQPGFLAIPLQTTGLGPTTPVIGQGPPKRRRLNFEGTEPAIGHVVPDHELESEDGYARSDGRVGTDIEMHSGAEEEEDADMEAEVESIPETSLSNEWAFLSP